MTASAIYTGTIRHRRLQPRNEFTHRLSLVYVDLGELPSLLDGRLLARGPGALRFRRRDYLGPASLPLDVAVRDRVAELSGHRPAGPIRLLTQLRSFGLCFNPVSFYYCFEEGRAGSSTASWPKSPTRRGESATPSCCLTARRAPPSGRRARRPGPAAPAAGRAPPG